MSKTFSYKAVGEQVAAGVGCVLIVGAFAWATGVFTPEQAPSERELHWVAGGVVSNGPLYEIRNIEDTPVESAYTIQYDFAPVRFEQQRGKWLLLTFYSGSESAHVDGTAYKDGSYFQNLYEATADLPNLEVWAVRGHRNYSPGMPMLDTGMSKCVPGVLPNGHRYRNAKCFDRFFYGAYHIGDDGLWITPLRQWALAMAYRAGAGHPNRMMGAPQVMLVGPDGRLYVLPGWREGDEPTVRYSGAKAIAQVVRPLVTGSSERIVARNDAVRVDGDALYALFLFEPLAQDASDVRFANQAKTDMDAMVAQIRQNMAGTRKKSNLPWDNRFAAALQGTIKTAAGQDGAQEHAGNAVLETMKEPDWRAQDAKKNTEAKPLPR